MRSQLIKVRQRLLRAAINENDYNKREELIESLESVVETLGCEKTFSFILNDLYGTL